VKRIGLIFFIVLCSCVNVFGQGFDWQWSPRLPFTNTHTYLGVIGNYGLSSLSGNISFLENRITCESFSDAAGRGWSAGLILEHWLHYNDFAFSAAVRYENNILTSDVIDNVPLSPTLTGKYKTDLDLDCSSIALSLAVKYRAYKHLVVGAGIDVSMPLNTSFDVSEHILSTDIPPFSTNPPSYDRQILNGEIDAFSIAQVTPNIMIGYDLQFGLGWYFEPHLSVGYDANSLFVNDNVSVFRAKLGLTIYRALW
jgi:hypothetical protein